MRKFYYLTTLLMLLVSATSAAYDFESDGIYYDIMSHDLHTCSVSYDRAHKYAGDITIPSTVEYQGQTYKVTYISTWSLNGSDITSLNLPSTIDSIADHAFSNCSSLKEISIPNSITKIDQNTFNNCSSLTEINLPNSITEICDAAFAASGLKRISLPNSLKTIGDQVFGFCHNLESIDIPSSVTHIGNNVFWLCDKLSSVCLEDGTETVEIEDGWIFKNAKYAYIGRSVLFTTNQSSFSNVERVTIGSQVQDMGTQMDLSVSNGLKEITLLGNTPPSILPFTEDQYASVMVNVPEGSLDAYRNASVWKEFANITEVDVTGIRPTIRQDSKNTAVYDIMGRKLAKPSRGINIVNGKKVVVDVR